MKYLAIFFLLLLTPHMSEAYVATSKDAFTVDGKTGVFLIEYSFGHTKYPLIMPLHAQRQILSTNTVLSYDIIDEHGTPGHGTAYGIVLSDTPHAKGVYEIPRDTQASFRLLVLYTRTPEEVGTPFRLQVTSLPFEFKNREHLSLNPSELQYYVTPSLTLGGIHVTPVMPKG